MYLYIIILPTGLDFTGRTRVARTAAFAVSAKNRRTEDRRSFDRRREKNVKKKKKIKRQQQRGSSRRPHAPGTRRRARGSDCRWWRRAVPVVNGTARAGVNPSVFFPGDGPPGPRRKFIILIVFDSARCRTPGRPHCHINSIIRLRPSFRIRQTTGPWFNENNQFNRVESNKHKKKNMPSGQS